MRLKQGLLIAVLFMLLGCKAVQIHNGKLPDEYLPYARPLMGLYQGSFEGRNALIKLTLQGQRPILQFIDHARNDLLGEGCHSKIGELKTIIAENRKGSPQIWQAEFALDPGHCNFIEGRRVIVRTFKANTLELRVLDHHVLEDDCDPRFPPPYDGHHCGQSEVPVYLEGYFVRKKHGGTSKTQVLAKRQIRSSH